MKKHASILATTLHRSVSHTPALSRRSLALSGVALAIALCAWSPVARAATPADTLIIAEAIDDMIGLDPAEAFEITTGEIMGNTYDRLVRIDSADPTKLYGDVAKSWTVSADGKTYNFELKPGLKFASGNPLTADEVVWSLQRVVLLDKAPAFILTQFGLTKDNVKTKVRQTGPLSLSIETDKAYAPTLLLNCLTANVGAVVDKTLALSKEANGDMGNAWLKTNYAGSGPYKIREWRANEAVVLERNDKYGGNKPQQTRIIYRHIKESATQRLMLEKGDIDIARNLLPQDLAALKSPLKTTSSPKGTVYYISMNQKNPILTKPEVREAFKWLVDYQAISATIIKGIGVEHQNFLPVGMLGASKTNPYKLDVAKAKALLTKAGYPNGFKITMDVRSVDLDRSIAEAMQQTAARAGIQIELLMADGKQVLTKYRARSHDLYFGNWGADYWDPHSNAETFTSNSDNSDGAKLKPLAWRNAWEIPELTKRTDAAMMERDATKRKALYESLQADFRNTSPFIMLYQQIETAAYRSNVEGLHLGATFDTTYLFNVRKR